MGQFVCSLPKKIESLNACKNISFKCENVVPPLWPTYIYRWEGEIFGQGPKMGYIAYSCILTLNLASENIVLKILKCGLYLYFLIE
jgi:hypothetical protein